MQEPAIEWGAIALFASILIGWIAINLLMQWRERKRRRLSRGFRNMKPVAHRQRARARQVKWAEHHPARQAAASSNAGGKVGWR